MYKLPTNKTNVIKLTENQLKNVIQESIEQVIAGNGFDVIFNGGFERGLINLVESKGVAISGNLRFIKKATQKILKSLNKGNSSTIIMACPLKFANEVHFVFVEGDEFGMAYSPDETGTMSFDNWKFPYITIKIKFFSQSTKQQIESGIVHELNHATEDFYRKFHNSQKQGNTTDNLYGFADYYDEPSDDRISPKYFDYASNTKFPSVCSDFNVNAAFRNIMYYIYTNTEFNAHVAQVYGELDALKSTRGKLKLDLPKTITFQNYKLIKDNNFPLVSSITDKKIWANFFKLYFHNFIDCNHVEHYRNQFLKRVNTKLNEFYTRLCVAADQYYIDKEHNTIKGYLKNKIISLKKMDI